MCVRSGRPYHFEHFLEHAIAYSVIGQVMQHDNFVFSKKVGVPIGWDQGPKYITVSEMITKREESVCTQKFLGVKRLGLQSL